MKFQQKLMRWFTIFAWDSRLGALSKRYGNGDTIWELLSASC